MGACHFLAKPGKSYVLKAGNSLTDSVEMMTTGVLKGTHIHANISISDNR